MGVSETSEKGVQKCQFSYTENEGRYLRFLADRTAANLRHGGYLVQAERMENCCRLFSAQFCEHCGSEKLRASSPHHCHVRLCPFCEEIRAVKDRKISRRYLEKTKIWPVFLTLTVKNRPYITAQWISDNLKSFRRLRQRKAWDDHVVGGFYSLEVTHTEEKGYHPHIHIAMDAHYWNHREISRIWEEVTRGDGKIIAIKEICGDGVEEFCKYVAKASQYSDQWRVTCELFKALSGKRLFAGFGEWFGAVKEMSIEIDAERKNQLCPECGSGLTWIGFVNEEDVYICPSHGDFYVSRGKAGEMILEHGNRLKRIARIKDF